MHRLCWGDIAVPADPDFDPVAASRADDRFRLIFETAFQFIGLLDTDGTMLEVNRSALAWARAPREAVIGQPVWQTPWWVHAGDVALTQLRAAVAAAAQGQFVRYDVTLASPDGVRHTFDFSLNPITDDTGRVVQLVAEGRDITELKRLEQALRESNEQLELARQQARQLAITDELSGLYNRRGFFVVADQQRRLAARSHARGLLMFVDIDDLKLTNDEYGHEVGDALIVAAASVLTSTFRASDLVARLGGDEFAVLASLGEGDSSSAFAHRLATHLEALNAGQSLRVPLRLSMGMHEFPWAEDTDLESLIAHADVAMYRHKREKKDGAAPGGAGG
jgi:diguanylate cyclase (GGDEF)-like protein/PAS domain S-box-containing protein